MSAAAPPMAAPAAAIAIVGAGPAGFYCAEALLKLLPGAAIDIIDRLPTPYGLVRAGVAPDHQGTKAVTRVFDRTAQKPGVRFLGNVTVGDAVTLAELTGLYDAVVLAFGAVRDRTLDIPGERLAGVFGSGAFVGWYNGHPDCAALPVALSTVRSVAVIGNGNVAIDVARVLAKTPAEMAKSDLAPYAAQAIHAAPIADIHIIGRRGPVEAGFTNAELAELGRLERAVPLVHVGDVPETAGDMDAAIRKVKDANLATLRGFAGNRPDARPLRLHLHFWTRPLAFHGAERLQTVHLQRGAPGESPREFDLPVELAISCIGYRIAAPAGVPVDAARGIVVNDQGRVAPGLYVVGWAKRGPSGVIATNRVDSITVAERLAADLAAPPAGDGRKPGPAGLDRLLASRGHVALTFADWRRIEAAETSAGGDGVPRRKLVTIADMLELVRRPPTG